MLIISSTRTEKPAATANPRKTSNLVNLSRTIEAKYTSSAGCRIKLRGIISGIFSERRWFAAGRARNNHGCKGGAIVKCSGGGVSYHLLARRATRGRWYSNDGRDIAPFKRAPLSSILFFALQLTCIPPVPPLSPSFDATSRQCTSHLTPAVFRAGIRNVVDKILRAAICRPVTPCRRRSLDFACRLNSLNSFSLLFLTIFACALDDSSLEDFF